MDSSSASWNLEVKTKFSPPSQIPISELREQDTAAVNTISAAPPTDCNETFPISCAVPPGPEGRTHHSLHEPQMLSSVGLKSSQASSGPYGDEHGRSAYASWASTKERGVNEYVKDLQEAGRYALWAPLLHGASTLEEPSLLLGQIRFDVTADDQRGSWLLPEELLAQQRRPVDEDGDDRQLFTNTPITEEEQQAIDHVLMQLLEVQRQKDVGNNAQKLPEALLGVQPAWLEQLVLRYLYSCSFDKQKTFDLLQSTLTFRTQQLPVLESEVYHELRNMGACYWHGRDRKMRPLLVVSLQRLQQLQREAAVEEKVTRLVVFCLEFFLRYLCVAGVVENWCILCDLNGTSISSFPLPLLLKLVQLIQGSYRGRLYRFYILYAPRLFHFIAKPLVSSLPATTAKKLRVFTSPDDWHHERRAQFAGHQLEKKYGGTAPDIIENWYPFRFFPGPFEPECEAGHSGASQTAVRWESDQALHERVHPLVHTGVSLHTSLIWKRGAEKQGGPFRYAAWLRYLPELRLAPATVEWAKGMLSTRLQGCHDSLAQQNVQQGEATEVLEAPDSSECTPFETSATVSFPAVRASCPSQLALADKTGGIKTVEIVENLSKKAPDSPAYAVVDADGRCWECPLDHTTVFTPRLQIHSPLRAAQISVGEADQNVNDVSSIPPLFLSVDRREPPLEDSPARVERLPKDFPPQAPSGQVPHVPRNTRSSQSFTCWGMQGTAGKASTSAPAGPYSHLDVSSAQSDAQTEDQPILHNNSTVKHSSECFPKHSCRRDGWQILAAAGRQLDGNTVKTVDAPFYPVVCSSCQQEVEVETVVSQPGSPPPLQHPYSTGSLGGTCRTVSLSASGTLERALGSPSNAAWQNAPSCEGSPKWNLSAFKSSPSFPCDAMRASSKPERLPCTLRPSTAQITVHYTRAVAAVNNTADLKASMGHRVDRGLQYTKLARTVSQVDAGRMRVQGSTHFLSPVAAEPSPSVSVYSFTGSSLSETCLVCEDLSNFQDGATSRTDDAGSQMRKDTDPGPLGSTPPPPEKSHTKTPEEQPSATVGVLIEPQTSRVMELRRLKRVMRALYSSVSGTYRRSETKQQLDHDDATPEATLTGRLYRRYTGKQLQTTEKAHQFDVVEPEKRHGIGLRRRLSRRLLSLDFHATATPCSGGIPKPWGKRHYYRRGSLYRRGSETVSSTRFSFRRSTLRSNKSDSEAYAEPTGNERLPLSLSAVRGTSKRLIRLPISFSDRVRRGTLVLARSMQSRARRSGTM